MEKDRQGFVFFRSYANSIRFCPDDAQLALFWAIVNYSLDFEQPDFSSKDAAGFLRAIWEGLKPNLDGNINRFLNGSKGGAPKGSRNNPAGRPNSKPRTNRKQTENLPIKNEEKKVEDSLFGAGDETPEPAKSLSFPFTSQKFTDTWQELCRQPKWEGKSIDALQMSLNKIADYTEDYAIMLMENAIANNYQGLVFSDTPAKYEQWKKNNPGQPQRREGRPINVEDL